MEISLLVLVGIFQGTPPRSQVIGLQDEHEAEATGPVDETPDETHETYNKELERLTEYQKTRPPITQNGNLGNPDFRKTKLLQERLRGRLAKKM